MGLVELLTFNSIPNIDVGNNKFFVGEEGEVVITIQTGSYEIHDIEQYLQKVLSIRGISISLQPNNNALFYAVKSSVLEQLISFRMIQLGDYWISPAKYYHRHMHQ